MAVDYRNDMAGLNDYKNFIQSDTRRYAKELAAEKALASGELKPTFYEQFVVERGESEGILPTLTKAVINLPVSTFKLAGELGHMLLNPIDTGEAVLRLAAGAAQKALPDSWEAYLPEDWAVNKEYANAVADFYKERYGSWEGVANALAEDPASVLLDVFIVRSVVQGAAKAGTNLTKKTNGLATTAEGTVLEDALTQKAVSVNVATEEVRIAANAVNKGEVLTTVERYDRLMKEKTPDGNMPNAEVAKIAEKNPELKTAIMNDIEQVYPIMNQAQREAKLARDNARMADESIITNKSLMDEAVNAEAAATRTEALSWFPTTKRTRKTAEEKIAELNAKKTGMVTEPPPPVVKPMGSPPTIAEQIAAYKAAQLAKGGIGVQAPPFKPIPWWRPQSKKTSKSKTKESKTKAGEQAKTAELAAQYTKRGDMYPLKTAAGVTKLAELANVAEPPVTAIGLEGLRAEDGSFYPDYGPDLTSTAPAAPVEESVIPAIKSTSRPGWMQGNTHAPDDGNWWSADFDDEHWNTPAGVNEAISIWGRPMGSRHSWETPAAIKNQYTNRQQPDWSWMNQYD